MPGHQIRKSRILACLLLPLLLAVPLLSGCAAQPPASTPGTPPGSLSHTPETQGEGSTVHKPAEATFITLSISDPGEDWPLAYPIGTEAQLQDFYSANQTALALDDGPEGERFADRMQKYDADYFAGNALVLVLFGEGDGSTTHSLESVEKSNGTLVVTIRRHSPMVVLTVLTQWLAFVEVDKTQVDVPVEVRFVNE